LNIETAYNDIDDLSDDPAQRRVVRLLATLQRRLEHAPPPPRNAIARLLSRRRRMAPVPGIYLWGGVGRGKTFLMDLFFRSLDLEHKRRFHFHRFMGRVHDELGVQRETADPLDRVAERLAADARVLCFDEFFVSDIGDAMILGTLLERLFRRNVTLVATSNTPPADLYAGGLQRERFLPAIRLLETHTAVVELDGRTDYRLRLLEQAGTFVPAGRPDAHDVLCGFFRRIASGDAEEGRVIDILGRPVRTVRAARSVAWFEFSELCGGPRSARDYVELARLCHTVLVSGIPELGSGREDEARRFIALVDELYDRRVKLILSAEVPIEGLYRGKRLRREFERTRSRLVEMQSTEYLAAPHAA